MRAWPLFAFVAFVCGALAVYVGMTLVQVGAMHIPLGDGKQIALVLRATPASEDAQAVPSIDDATREALKAALLECNRISELASRVLDATLLAPCGTSQFVDEHESRYAVSRASGRHSEIRLVHTEFKSFRMIGVGAAEVDSIEIWDSRVVDINGRQVNQSRGRYTPQTNTLRWEGGRWKVHSTVFYDADKVPFTTTR